MMALIEGSHSISTPGRRSVNAGRCGYTQMHAHRPWREASSRGFRVLTPGDTAASVLLFQVAWTHAAKLRRFLAYKAWSSGRDDREPSAESSPRDEINPHPDTHTRKQSLVKCETSGPRAAKVTHNPSYSFANGVDHSELPPLLLGTADPTLPSSGALTLRKSRLLSSTTQRLSRRSLCI